MGARARRERGGPVPAGLGLKLGAVVVASPRFASVTVDVPSSAAYASAVRVADELGGRSRVGGAAGV